MEYKLRFGGRVKMGWNEEEVELQLKMINGMKTGEAKMLIKNRKKDVEDKRRKKNISDVLNTLHEITEEN